MQENLKDIHIEIPGCLGQVVEESLRQVSGLHRRRILKRLSTAAACFAVGIGALFVLGCTNPALAAQIPLLGRLFQTVNTDSKAYGSLNLESYGDAVQQIGRQAESTNPQIGLTVAQGYCDGYEVQLALELTLPQDMEEKYSAVEAQMGKSSTVLIDGVEALYPYDMSINSFSKLEGRWFTTLRAAVPQELLGKEQYEVALTLRGLSGFFGDGREPEPLDGEFTTEFSLLTDKEHSFSFKSSAEDNGAKVLEVSGTPARTAITVEKPYWGEVYPDAPEEIKNDPDIHPLGFPRLYTEDGQEIQRNNNAERREEFPYDMQCRETQTARLVFDGVPRGTERVILQFVEGGGSEKPLAKFLIDLKAQTVTAAE